MFDIKLNEPKLLNSTIGIISDFITEASFLITKEGIKLIAMDPANISMVVLNLLPSAFTQYSVESPEEITINLDSLKQAFKRAKPTDSLALTLEKNKLKITILGKSTKKFYIPLLEKEGKERKIPSLEFSAIIELDANEFQDYVEDASVVGDALTIEASPEAFVLSAGDAGSRVDIELKKGNEALVSFSVKESARSIYSVEYLRKMAKSSSLASTAKIQFKSDYPLRLDFKALDKAQMSFILAPRIETK